MTVAWAQTRHRSAGCVATAPADGAVVASAVVAPAVAALPAAVSAGVSSAPPQATTIAIANISISNPIVGVRNIYRYLIASLQNSVSSFFFLAQLTTPARQYQPVSLCATSKRFSISDPVDPSTSLPSNSSTIPSALSPDTGTGTSTTRW